MSIHLHTLKGCSPAPLANYLKALGILRLVSEQADKNARGWWDGEHFCLLTNLSKEALEKFFLEKYEPTPLLSPWNKGCGFFKANDPGLCPLEKSVAPRFKQFREGVIAARQLLNEISQADAVIRAIKARTKTTPRGFQNEEQRQLVANNETYSSALLQLKEQLEKADLAPEKRAEAEHDIATIRSLTRKAKPPTKSEADVLKASAGFKRLLAAADRRFKSLKAMLIPDCRRAWRGAHAEWISAAVVLDEEGSPIWPSLLGTGGNDGNLDFTNNFMQQIGKLFDVGSNAGDPTTKAGEFLGHSLWSDIANNLSSAAVGQYQPGSAGGANSSTGFASGNLVNPWDFVFMMEGSLLFTCRATRRLDPNALGRASAPFVVRSHAAGFATPGSEKAQRGEQWMPLWAQPTTLTELTTMYGEARIQLGRQTANRPVDVARAVSRLGASRGITSFVRYGYLERNGQSTLAVPLGHVRANHHPRAYLLDDLAGWMDRIQHRARSKNAQVRLIHAERRLADAVFDALTHDHTFERWQAILLAASDIELIQATGTAIEAQPIPPLRPDWFSVVNDESPEVRLALALGSASSFYKEGRPVDPIRHHWLPLQPGALRFKTADKRLVNDPRKVALGRDLLQDLAAVVQRRLIEAGIKGQRRLRLVAATGCGARLDDIAGFLSGLLDLRKLVGMARAFMAFKWDQWTQINFPLAVSSNELPAEAWLTVRLAHLAWPLFSDIDIPAEPRILRLLLSDNPSRALVIARSRLQSAGIRSPLQTGVTDAATASLWAAALAFPITHRSAVRAAVVLKKINNNSKPTRIVVARKI